MGAPSPTRQGVKPSAVKRLVAVVVESVSDWVHSSSALPIWRTKSTEAVRLRIASTSKTAQAFRNLRTIASISSERSVATPSSAQRT
jgi:hypothetical protein